MSTNASILRARALAGIAIADLTLAALAFGAGLLPSAAARAQPPTCDRACLAGLAKRYMAALVAHTPAKLPWAERVRFTENEVPLMIGDGAWGTVTNVSSSPYIVADPVTGNVLWFGVVEEHGEPAYFGVRLRVIDRRIAEVESVAGREGTPIPFAKTAGYALDASFTRTLPAAERQPRARLIALADGYYNTMQLNDGQLFTEFDPACRRVTNGVVSRDDGRTDGGGKASADGGTGPQSCGALFANGYFKPVDRVRARRFPIVDTARGVVVAFAFLDHTAHDARYRTRDGKPHTIAVQYPNSDVVLELIKIRGGKVYRVEGVAAFLPYLMPTIFKP